MTLVLRQRVSNEVAVLVFKVFVMFTTLNMHAQIHVTSHRFPFIFIEVL